MSITDAPGGGTIVTVDIPVAPNGSANGNGGAHASNGNGE
jgi:hypothetical protein